MSASKEEIYRKALREIELITLDDAKHTARGHLKSEYVGRIQKIIREALSGEKTP